MICLVVGLGSMGQRRIRNLQALGKSQIIGIDPNTDRCTRVAELSGIQTYKNFDEAIAAGWPDVMIVSTPPDRHLTYANWAKKNNVACFIEASVVDHQGIANLAAGLSDEEVIVPSSTMRFFPGPQKIRELLSEHAVGNVLNINYVTGQYLPDWHPWESISDYYVSERATGGCREIVPFEMTWLNELFGHPEPIACLKTKCSNMDAEIDDIYHCLFRYPAGPICNLAVEVLSRPEATREMLIIGENGKILFSQNSNTIDLYVVGQNIKQTFDLGENDNHAGYINPETPYINEIASFLSAVEHKNRHLFPNSLERDAACLRVLEEFENLSGVSHEVPR